MLQISAAVFCFLGLILILGINAQTDGLCTTLRNEKGVCVPISTCRAIIQLLQGVPPPLERLKSEDQSVCGGSHSNTNICCVLSNISNNNTANTRTSISAETQGYCRSLNGKDEVCLPILECATIINLLKLSSSPERLPPPVVETVRQAHCGTVNNVPHVCCMSKSREVTAPKNPTSDGKPVIQRQGRCMTQQNEIGACVPILNCAMVVQLLNTSSVSGSLTPSVVDSVKMSHCGTFDNIVHVCCARNHVTRKVAFTTTTSRSIGKGSQSSCITLKNEMGKCLPILTCAPIVELLQTSPFPLPKATVNTIRKSHCGTFNDIHHVCCAVANNVPSTPNTERAKAESQVDQGPCTTLRNEMGLCVPLLSCKIMTRLLEFSQQPMPSFVSKIIKQSHCGTFNNNHYVCCKINSTTNLATSKNP